MKKVFLSICFTIALLLGATVRANSLDVSNQSIDSSDADSIITRPIQLFYRNPQTNLLEEVDFIEPDFEIPPENYLYEINQQYDYTVHFQLPATDEIITSSIDIDYSNYVISGNLGTIEILCNATVQDGDTPRNITYYGILKFVATGELNLIHTAAKIDEDNLLSFKLTQNTNQHYISSTIATIPTFIRISNSLASQNLYTTDLTNYLYPSRPAAFRGEKWNFLANYAIHRYSPSARIHYDN